MSDQTQTKPLNILRGIDSIGWLILLILLPIFLFLRVETCWILLVIPLLWGGSALIKAKPIPVTPLNAVLFLLALQVLVSLYATYDIAVSLPKVGLLVYSIALFYAFVKLSMRTRGLVISSVVLGAAGLGIAALGLFGTNWATTKITELNPVYNLFPKIQAIIPEMSDGFHPNEVAGAIVWVLPVWVVVLGWTLVRGKKLIPLIRAWGYATLLTTALLAVALMVVVLVFTQSRSAYLGFAAGLLLLVFLLLPKKFKWIFLAFLAIGVGFLIYFIQNGQFMVFINSLFPGTSIGTTAFSINTLNGRIEIWARGIYAIQDFAFTGMGMNTFRHIVHVLYPLYTVSADVPLKDIGHVHNEILQSGLDLGFPGMIAFIGLNILVFWMLLTNLKTIRKRSHRPIGLKEIMSREFCFVLSLGLISGLFAHFVFGITDAIALGAKPGVVFWIMSGMATSIFMKAQRRDFQ
jgi:putative inorganic carbon (HCO3(-)) transporter